MALRLRLCAAKFAMPRILHEKYLAILQNKSVLIYKQWSPVRLWDLVQSTNVSVVETFVDRQKHPWTVHKHSWMVTDIRDGPRPNAPLRVESNQLGVPK